MPAVPIEIDFVLHQGDFTVELHEGFEARSVALVGPSGAGKTTVLDAIAGLRHPTSGRIVVGGQTLYDSTTGVDLAPRRRGVGYVPQDVALFPHFDVRQNVEYGIGRGIPPDLDLVLDILEIRSLVDRTVDGLSGGERQRVAFARALMSGPDLMLLDEPLAAVDPTLRERILPYIERVRDEIGTPVIYVSHAADEVERIADRVIELRAGRVVGSHARVAQSPKPKA